ncbi:MAG: glycosyltransferase, partial [Candidatus Nanoarchaeia archaeon]|nr:glycosyltransferase [Candidatus Nanoarchaeia archaeon]
LDSIKKQKFQDYEVIVSDSGSTDNTAKIAKSYGAKVITDPKRGPGAGRNLGAKHAQGELLMFMDSDSVLKSDDMFNAIIETMNKKDVGGGFFKVKGIGKKSWLYNHFFNTLLELFCLLKKPLTGGYCIFVDKKSFDALNGFDENIEICEDFDFSWRIIKKLNKKVKYVRKRTVETSTRRWEHGSLKQPLEYSRAFLNFLLFKKVPKDKFKFKAASELKK